MAPHIALFSTCTPFTIPIGELASLVVDRGFTTTVITLADTIESHPQDHFLESLHKPQISHEIIPSLSLDDLSDDTGLEHRLAVTGERSAPYLGPILQKLKQTHNLVGFVADPISACNTIAIPQKLGIPTYVFFTSTITSFMFCYHFPELEAKLTCDFRHLEKPLTLPGCLPIKGTDMFHSAQDRESYTSKALVHIFEAYKKADGFLINSFVELEPSPYKALKEMQSKGQIAPCHVIGPVIPLEGWGEDSNGCLTWLDGQPKSSVLFVSFGSGGTLTSEQTVELAHGLEKSGKRFLWVVRWPTDRNTGGAYFNLKKRKDDVLGTLPEGFLERTKERGLVVPLWAPQVKVLKHRAVGGMVTHCGWSSVLEGICLGVPLIAWPIHSEQHVNAVVINEGVGVALRVKEGENGVVSRDEVVSGVKELFDGAGGASVKSKVKEVRAAAEKAAAEGGSSYEAIGEWCASLAK